ncbi:MAG: xanthine dehydrogenase family protein molybdopterin-binding subunit [Planctomycetes bacterium]|nr:xanthine dehydrogenase family protein molybdopterin-binding subunit [Planctomycetota bacterium]
MGKIKTKVGFRGNVKEIEVTIPDHEPAPWDAETPLKVVGTDVPRLEASLKVTGRAKYTADIHLHGMLIAKILHAPYGAARIKKLDVSAAEAMPGVRGTTVFKGEGRPLLYHGDEILAIAADTEEQAEDAVAAVKVDYEFGTPVTTVEAAMKASAPSVFEGKENVQENKKARIRQNDPEKAIQEAAKIIEATYETQVQTHSCLEPHGVVARFNEDGSLTLWASTQALFQVRSDAAAQAKLPQQKVRVIAEHVGGGFGSKFALGPFGIAAIELAKKTGHPVKCVLTREGEHTTGGNRPSSIQKMRGGVTRDGKIAGVSVTTHGTGGVAGGAGCANPAVYHFPAVHKEEYSVYTHAGPAMAFRAPGHPQGFFALECFIDEMAEAVGLDPLEFRKRNCDNELYHAEWDLGAQKIGWKERRNTVAGGGPGAVKRGLGMASTLWYQKGGWKDWFGQRYAVEIVATRDGAVEVRNASQDIGTGLRTLLACIVAEELGLRPEEISVKIGDTDLPRGAPSGGSQVSPSIGPAARNAAFQLKKKVREVAGLGDGVTWKEACRRIEGEALRVTGERSPNYGEYKDKVAGCQFVEVEVNVETGRIRVKKVVAVQDAGKVIDKLTFESQIVGGVTQGISYALFENRILDRRRATQVNADFISYKIAGAADVPEIVPIAFDVANAVNNCGMMGLGEPPTIPTAAAIANAVHNAIGVRVRSLPMTPDKVLTALAGGEGRK